MTDELDFDPLQMMSQLMTGEVRLHSVFIAPFTPVFAAAREQYLADGSGPLTQIADELGRQGAPDPQAAARTMLGAAQGMAVVVLALDHGVATVPQLFFGHLAPEVRPQVVAACGPEFPPAAALEAALGELAERLGKDQWPALVVGPALGEDLKAYWLELAAALLEGTEGAIPGLNGGMQRLGDLAWWVSQAILTTNAGGQVEPDDLDLLVRCLLLAGDPAAAGQGIHALVETGLADEEGVIDLLGAFVEGALTAGQSAAAATWLAGVLPTWAGILGAKFYDLPLALFRLQAAAGFGPDELLPTAKLMAGANRKAARNDLTKEPLWEVKGDPGDLLDTAQAAERIGRSTSFIAKRLEARTIPWHRGEQTGGGEGDRQLRIPARALDGWKAVMDEFKMFD